MRQPRAGILSAVLGVLLTVPAFAAAYPAPHEVVASSAEQVADRLEGRRDFLAENPQELYSLIDEVLLPNFDTRYAGFLVLGRSNWNAASGQQRDRFVAAFFDFLVRNYAEGLLAFDPRSMEVLDGEEPADKKRTTVQTSMRQDNGTVVPIIYALRKTGDGWKVYDVRIEGVSYLQNYRNQFNAEISANGIDAVIARLEQETADVPEPAFVK
jgi:phospholipid transport system substrate-binding protein